MYTSVYVYYEGTEEQLLEKAIDFGMIYNIYFYTDCVHEANQWTFDDYGWIITYCNTYSELISHASCIAKEVIRYHCSTCGESWDVESEYFGSHSYDEYGTCIYCKETLWKEEQ